MRNLLGRCVFVKYYAKLHEASLRPTGEVVEEGNIRGLDNPLIMQSYYYLGEFDDVVKAQEYLDELTCEDENGFIQWKPVYK